MRTSLILASALSLFASTALAQQNQLNGVGTAVFSTYTSGLNSGTATCALDRNPDQTTNGYVSPSLILEGCALFPASKDANSVVVVRASGSMTCAPSLKRGATSIDLSASKTYLSDADGGTPGYLFLTAGERYDMRMSRPMALQLRDAMPTQHSYTGLCTSVVANGKFPGGLHAPCASSSDCDDSSGSNETCVTQGSVSKSTWEAMERKAGMYLVCESHASSLAFSAVTETIPPR